MFIFEINKDEIDKNTFDQKEFDFFYKSKYGNNPIYIICKDFIELLICENKIKNFSFDYYNSKWEEANSNLVMINDSSLFVSICDFYENYEVFIQNCFNDDKNRNNLEVVENKCKEFSEMVNTIQEKLHKKQMEIQKWCK